MTVATRIRAVFLLACAALGVLALRLGFLQLVKGSHYHDRAVRQIQQLELIGARRGAILDRNGVPLARDEAELHLAVVLPDLRDTDQVFANLVRVLGTWGPPTSPADLEEALARAEEAVEREVESARARLESAGASLRPSQEGRLRRTPQVLLRGVSRTAASFLLARGDHFPGIQVQTASVRRYPQGTLAGTLIGYLGLLNEEEIETLDRRGQNLSAQLRRYPRDWVYADRDLRRRGFFQDEWIGRSGLERLHEARLRGERGARLVERRIAPRPGEEAFDLLGLDPPSPGEDVTLTLDCRIQEAAEEALANPLKNRKGVPGAAVVLDPRDGAILALASHPPFDPSRRGGRGEFPRAYAGLYPLGSVAKLVPAAALLEERLASAADELPCTPGLFTSGNHTFGCSHDHGACDIERAIEVSCNNYFYGAAARLHKNSRDLGAWAARFGLGFPACAPSRAEPSPDDILPVDPAGTFPSPRSLSDAWNLAIGQGRCQATPLQAARMMAVFANGGALVTPYLEASRATPPRRALLRPETVRAIRRGLERVVTAGTARGAGLEAHRVAGKTGTAQTGREGEPHAWFVGYAPADEPAFVVAVVLEHAGVGGEEAGPVAEAIFAACMALRAGEEAP